MRPLGVFVALAVVACGSAEQVPRSSPLLAMESDRLWILLQAAKINPRCQELYAGSTDPRISGLAEKCEATERRVVAWLAANGVEDAHAQRLREPAFWQWYAKKLETIQACQRNASPGSATFWSTIHACDPYDRITRLEKRTLADAGYRQPKD